MELAYTICENLPWTAPNGQPRVHECLPLLEQLAEMGLITSPRNGHRPRRARPACGRRPCRDWSWHAAWARYDR